MVSEFKLLCLTESLVNCGSTVCSIVKKVVPSGGVQGIWSKGIQWLDDGILFLRTGSCAYFPVAKLYEEFAVLAYL